MKEVEIIDKRTSREKHFLREDGVMLARVYNEDIHYLKNNRYEEIDNTLVKKKNYYLISKNKYKLLFHDNSKNGIMKIKIDNNFLKFRLNNDKNVNLEQMKKVNKLKEEIKYKDILDNVDLKYQIISSKIKEEIILKNRFKSKREIVFEIISNFLLELNLDKTISLKKGEKTYFKIEAPYMKDANGNINTNVYYELKKVNHKYILKLILDQAWLNSFNTKYPVTIDPTITTYNQDNGVYDTYIYSGDTNIDRNSQDILKVGVERVNNQVIVNRALIKFDLPTLGTGSQIISAVMNLVGYPVRVPDYNYDILEVHRVTSNWSETTASWQTMNDKYDSRVEASFQARRSFLNPDNILEPFPSAADITDLVRKWYTDTPNYGLLLKANREEYFRENFPAFFSKNNSVTGTDPKPILEITYRNQNGLEDYMEYMTQYFDNGSAHINLYNGNMTTLFNIGRTIGGTLPANIDLLYNTNDVILNKNYGYGIGFKPSIFQTIKEEYIDQVKYLEYVDADGTIHYFKNKKQYINDNNEVEEIEETNKYFDEDNLNITIIENLDNYILKDKNNHSMTFTKVNNVGYLTEIKNLNNKKITITYNENNLITKVKDGNNLEINIVYETNKISVINPDQTVILNYSNNKLISIITLTGTTLFTYNDNNIISCIKSENSKKVNYEYYSQIPYKVKKITEYGLNNKEGVSYQLVYNFSATTITDNKNRVSTVTFNSYGNPISTSNLKANEDVNNSYGQANTYGELFQFKNKIIRNYLPIKSVKNYLVDSSFENSSNHGFTSINIPSSNIEIINTDKRSGNKCLRIIADQIGTVTKTVSVKKGKYYTFSAYFKNESMLGLSLSCDGGIELENSSVFPNSDFKRYATTIYFPEDDLNEYGNLSINLNFNVVNSVLIDDMQLEEGEVLNDYNYIENSDFSNGLLGWETMTSDSVLGETVINTDRYEVVTLANYLTALKIKMDPRYQTSINKRMEIPGKAGDLYTICFWYKNESPNDIVNLNYNNVIVNFEYADADSTGEEAFPSTILNSNNDEWQFFTYDFLATKDFDALRLSFFQTATANNLYITNISLFKDLRSFGYNYDEKGNIQKSIGLNEEATEFNYDQNNELIKRTTPKGGNFVFEYDNQVTDRVINGISATGITNQIKYDDFGNPVTVTIANYNQNKELENNTYKIRLKGSNNYLRIINTKLEIANDNHNHDLWNLVKSGDYFKINHVILSNLYLTNSNDYLVLANEQEDKSLFKLIKNENGSYSLQNKFNNKYVKVMNDSIILTDKENTYNFEFYLEAIDNNLFLETNATYSDDGRFIKSIQDSNLNKVVYDIDSVTGLTKSITNSKGEKTNYTYNQKRQLIKVENKDKAVEYSYNSNNLISKIKQNNKEYNFLYDDFLNTKQVKLGNDITFITNNYEDKNGNLKSCTYGNNDTVSYDYDEFDRITKITKMDDIYHYKYDNNSNLVKIKSNNYLENYRYDLSKNLEEYRFNDFYINYTYDKNNNILENTYKLGESIYPIDNENHSVYNTYNLDDTLINTSFDNSNNISYQYDYLGRIKNKKINDTYNTKYEYITNGNRTTTLIKSIENNQGKYSYKYDKLNNIKAIYYNDKLINKYDYDEYNQLIKENNYSTNETIRYVYDNSGNILSKNVYELNTYNLLHQDNYEYNNDSWKDQLTKFNNDVITYDAIGNPLTIGNKTLIWTNGRELKSLSDNVNNITYKYNESGIRISKKINNKEIKYYLEDNQIIYEKTDDKLIYFMYNEVDDLIGFTYNNQVYYYLKNICNDIIGILDSNYNLLAKYEYDSLGNILSIKNSNDEDISNNSNHIANINPFRYRSYYYDIETNLYYLNSRYYNPVWGRFLNAENRLVTDNNFNTFNQYAYANNNFINFGDYDGNITTSLVVSGVAALAYSIISYYTIRATASVVLSVAVEAAKSIPKRNKKTKKDNETKNQYVYLLVDESVRPNKVEYVGRTVNPDSREKQHKNTPSKANLTMDVINENEPMTYYAARGVEQILIEKYCSKQRGNKINNQIDGIRFDNDYYDDYMEAGKKFIVENPFVGRDTYVGNCN